MKKYVIKQSSSTVILQLFYFKYLFSVFTILNIYIVYLVFPINTINPQALLSFEQCTPLNNFDFFHNPPTISSRVQYLSVSYLYHIVGDYLVLYLALHFNETGELSSDSDGGAV